MFLEQHREHLVTLLGRYEPGAAGKFQSSQIRFLATACLQKSLRRGEREYARRAASALLAIDPARLWRRLTILACEDFGLVDLNLTAQIIAASADKRWRKRVGGDAHVMFYLVDQLLNCARDRRVDDAYMLSVSLAPQEPSSRNPTDRQPRTNCPTPPTPESVALVLRCEHLDPYRNMQSIIASECDVAVAKMTITSTRPFQTTGMFASSSHLSMSFAASFCRFCETKATLSGIAPVYGYRRPRRYAISQDCRATQLTATRAPAGWRF